jgi:hypothetical protein
VLLSAAIALAGCAGAPHPFERYVEAGRYEEAARAFEADSTLWNRPETLMLAGRVFSDPSVSTFDIERARTALERILSAFPGSPEASQARIVLPLLVEVEGVRRELAARTAENAARAAQADTLIASREASERQIADLRGRLQVLQAELQQVKEELERLKAIDLGPRSGAAR